MGSKCSSEASLDDEVFTSESISHESGSQKNCPSVKNTPQNSNVKKKTKRFSSNCMMYRLTDTDSYEWIVAVLKITVDPFPMKRASISCMTDLSPGKEKSRGLLRDPTICWGSLMVKQQIPKCLPAVLPEGTMKIYAILKKETPDISDVTLYGSVEHEEIELSTKVINDVTLSSEETEELIEFLKENDAKKERKKTKKQKKHTRPSSDAGYDSLPEQGGNRMSLSSAGRKVSITYAPGLRKMSVVGKRRTFSTTTIDNSFKEAYFTPQGGFDEEYELPEVRRSRRDTPVINSLNVGVNPVWRSTSDILREDAEEADNLAVPRGRIRSDSVMVVTSLFGSNDAFLDSIDDLEQTFEESTSDNHPRKFSNVRRPSMKRRLTVGIDLSFRNDSVPEGDNEGQCTHERSRSLPSVDPDRALIGPI